jgi:CheY-like chemotaxis protein
MDMQMRLMDRFEATSDSPQRADQRGHITIYALTAQAMEGGRESCLRAGMDGYLSKPVNMADLESAINEASLHRSTT